jgi:hypothetical protein
MTLYFFITLIGIFAAIYLLSRVKFKKRKRVSSIVAPPGFPKTKPKENKDGFKYPEFIPFYQWHGFWRGLHWENRLFYSSKGKYGRCPKNFDNPFK